jgi:hypothetical protein
MKEFDQTSAKCLIFTYKEGLLSPLAHDLRLDVGSFVVELGDDSMINAVFDAGSLRVDCAMAEGVERPDLLSDADRKEINSSIFKEVLQADTYPKISFGSLSVQKEDSTHLVTGTLSLHGIDKEITFTVRREGDYFVADACLHMPDFGIKPFSALFGAVRIKPDILIRVTLPVGAE